MKTLVVFAHPESQSFCAELARRAVVRMRSEGEVRLIDLYAEDFDPVIRPAHFPQRTSPARFEPMVEQAHQAATSAITPDVAKHQAAVDWSDRLVLVFPLWWWSMPAMLKGWIDRVFSTDFAYGARNLDGRIGMVCATAETKSDRFEPTDGNNPLHHIERGILKFCGFHVAPSFVAADIYDLSDEDRRRRLSDFEAWLTKHLASSGITGTSS
jgi:NAD(P)H dehydrogenase (quinone)